MGDMSAINNVIRTFDPHRTTIGPRVVSSHVCSIRETGTKMSSPGCMRLDALQGREGCRFLERSLPTWWETASLAILHT